MFGKKNRNFLGLGIPATSSDFSSFNPKTRPYSIWDCQQYAKPKKFLQDKKGFLLAEETLKILVAVIALVFLVYFLTSLYFAKVNGDKLNQAESWLISSDESLSVLINNLNDGETKTKDIIEPKGWQIFSFSGDELKPNSCANENCVCICDNVLWDGLNNDRQQKECADAGICLLDNRFGDFPDIKVTGELKILDIISKEGKVYIVEGE